MVLRVTVLGAGEHALPAQQGSKDAAVQDVRSANNMNNATQPQHFTLRTGSSTSGSPASSRALGARVAQLRDLAVHCLRQPAHVVQVPLPLLGQPALAEPGVEGPRLLQLSLRMRALALLQAINSWPSFSPQQGMMLQLRKLEQAQREYELASNTTLTDDHKMAILLKCLTGQLKQYTNLMIADSSTYGELRQLVQRWELSQTKWANPIAASYQDQDEPTPMEIDQIKGKGKGKGKHDKGKGKNKPGKDKGGKGKDKQPGKSEKGKGYGNQKGKGNGPGPSSNVCLHCGKPGHWKRDCWQ